MVDIMFTLLFLTMLFAILFTTSLMIGLWLFGIVLFVIGCVNLWRAKWLEPTDYVDEAHMERDRKRTKSKAIIQMVIGFLLFIIYL